MIDILRRPFRRWIAAAAACVALLAACGGGAPADTARPQAAASVQTAAASPTQLLTPYVLYNWAVTAYPALFPYCPPLSGGWLCDPDKATGTQPLCFIEHSKHDMRIGYYNDTYVRTGDGWRLKTRAMTFIRRNGDHDSGRPHAIGRPEAG